MEFAPELKRGLCPLRSLYRPAIQTICRVFKFTYSDIRKKPVEVWLFLFGQKLASLIRAFLSAANTGSFTFRRGRSGCGNQTNPWGNTCFHGWEITVKAAQRPATGTVHRFLRALRDLWGVLRVFPPVCPGLERGAAAPAVPGSRDLLSPVSLLGSLLGRCTEPGYFSRASSHLEKQGGTLCSVLPGVLWSKRKLRLSSFRLFWICLLAAFSNLLVLTVTHDK